MSFLNVLKGILHVGQAVAPEVATAVNPAAGAIVGLVVNAVTKAEQAGGKGPDKKAQVMKEVLPVTEGILNAVLQAKGVKIDSTQLNNGLSSIVDGVVSLLNSMGAKPLAATVSGAPATPPAANPPTGN